MSVFEHLDVPVELLRERAFNLRWATLPEDVIPLTAADPDFPAAEEIRDAIQRYAAEGVFSYGPPMGLPSFRASAARWLERDRGIKATPDSVFVANSAASALFIAANFVLSAGDEALVMDPVDFLLQRAVMEAKGRVVLFPVDHEHRLDVEVIRKRITPRTRAIFLCNPHNPLGIVFHREELQAVAELADAHDLWLVSDEVWSDIVYEPFAHSSIAALDPRTYARTLTIYGFSKTFALAGLRIGLLAAPTPKIANALSEIALAPTTAYGVSTLSQVAAEAALEKGWHWVRAFKDHLRTMRDLTVARLNHIPGVECATPEGTYVAFPDISALGRPSSEVAQHLLEHAKVAVVPGTSEWFGPGAVGHLRICFSTSRKILEEGLERIEVGIRDLNEG